MRQFYPLGLFLWGISINKLLILHSQIPGSLPGMLESLVILFYFERYEYWRSIFCLASWMIRFSSTFSPSDFFTMFRSSFAVFCVVSFSKTSCPTALLRSNISPCSRSFSSSAAQDITVVVYFIEEANQRCRDWRHHHYHYHQGRHRVGCPLSDESVRNEYLGVMQEAVHQSALHVSTSSLSYYFDESWKLAIKIVIWTNGLPLQLDEWTILVADRWIYEMNSIQNISVWYKIYLKMSMEIAVLKKYINNNIQDFDAPVFN